MGTMMDPSAQMLTPMLKKMSMVSRRRNVADAEVVTLVARTTTTGAIRMLKGDGEDEAEAEEKAAAGGPWLSVLLLVQF